MIYAVIYMFKGQRIPNENRVWLCSEKTTIFKDPYFRTQTGL